MSEIEDTLVLQLPADLRLIPFDSGAREQEYVLALPGGQHYRLTARLQQLVECIDGQRTLAEIAVLVSQKWQQAVQPEQVWKIAQQYLAPHGLLVNASSAPVAAFQPQNPFSWHTRLLSARQI